MYIRSVEGFYRTEVWQMLVIWNTPGKRHGTSPILIIHWMIALHASKTQQLFTTFHRMILKNVCPKHRAQRSDRRWRTNSCEELSKQSGGAWEIPKRLRWSV